MRLFLDADVLFSAAYLETSRPAAFFELSKAGVCQLLASAYVLDEARRNITLKYSAKLPQLKALIAQLSLCAESGREMLAWAAQSLPPKDAPVLAAAASARADVLMTGDRTDFGHLYGKRLRGVEVMSPRAALECILGRSS